MNDTAARHDERRRAVATVARLYAEWQRGLRPLSTLRPLLSVELHAELAASQRNPCRSAATGRVTAGDITGVQVQQPLPTGRFHACAAIRDPTGGWHIVAFEIGRSVDGDWQIMRLGEADRQLLHGTDEHTPLGPGDADRQLARIGYDRVALGVVGDNLLERLRQDPADAAAVHRLAGLRQRLATLEHRINRMVGERTRRNFGQTTPLTAPQLASLLTRTPGWIGPQRQRVEALTVVQTYADRWNQPDLLVAFAVRPEHRVQLAHWHTIGTRAVRILEAGRDRPTVTDIARDHRGRYTLLPEPVGLEMQW